MSRSAPVDSMFSTYFRDAIFRARGRSGNPEDPAADARRRGASRKAAAKERGRGVAAEHPVPAGAPTGGMHPGMV
ncbi:MAG: hypothetical protein K9L66_05135 [Spirochaetaceae bacterium]|nr:hypothetical protein [Spirochaetaceae bacterium]MCF7948160.1 hypothetical protein [Spirochaetia bacterium]MCF7951037.1 hypothetical protein [Spirochaetaceae bacterium]